MNGYKGCDILDRMNYWKFWMKSSVPKTNYSDLRMIRERKILSVLWSEECIPNVVPTYDGWTYSL